MSAAKRRRKAVARRRWVAELRQKWDERQAIARFFCSCGFRAWLGQGATAEDHAWMDDLADQHASCDPYLDAGWL